jgi:hypothetical protein
VRRGGLVMLWSRAVVGGECVNGVEIEEAVSELASVAFNAGEFPFVFLTAFGNRQVTVHRLRAGSGNASDIAGGVLRRNNIHMAVCAEGRVSETLSARKLLTRLTMIPSQMATVTWYRVTSLV